MKRIALVTGGNRGIGKEICRQLARQGILTILGSRDEAKGKKAAAELAAEGLEVVPLQLDVSNEASIRRCHESISSKYGRLDILINNAGVLLDSKSGDWDLSRSTAFRASLDVIRSTMETNVYGPLLLCQLFLPMMVENGYGRVVNVSSGMGQLSDMGPGWAGYRLSKAGINVLTRIFSQEIQGKNVLINSASPGWVKTDMGGPDAQVPVEEGVDTILWLATLPDDGPTGGFFEDRQSIGW